MPDGALIIDTRPRDIGGFEVRRVLPFHRRRVVGPFVFFDHMGPADFEPGGGIDVRPHPHIGLATVTYLFSGEIVHRDSLGIEQAIRPGDVNWMTAGRGIVHSERTGEEPRRTGQRLAGIQSWIGLPLDKEETDPGFAHHPAETLPEISGSGADLRLIAGSAFGETSPVETFSPMFYLEARMQAGASLRLPEQYQEKAVYVVDGAVTVDDASVGPAQMAALPDHAPGEIAATEDSHLMLLGGDALAGKRHLWWNFVSSSQDRIEQAKDDWRNGRFSKVPGETEFIPLPEN